METVEPVQAGIKGGKNDDDDDKDVNLRLRASENVISKAMIEVYCPFN